jgi:hypothetical protein
MEELDLHFRAFPSHQYSVASYATLRVLNSLHSPGPSRSCCNVVRLYCGLEACNLVTTVIESDAFHSIADLCATGGKLYLTTESVIAGAPCTRSSFHAFGASCTMRVVVAQMQCLLQLLASTPNNNSVRGRFVVERRTIMACTLGIYFMQCSNTIYFLVAANILQWQNFEQRQIDRFLITFLKFYFFFLFKQSASTALHNTLFFSCPGSIELLCGVPVYEHRVANGR